MNFDDICFSSNPNFRFKEVITDKSDCLSSTYQFDCYKDKNGETILISPFFDYPNILKQEHHISLINLKNNKVIKKLEGHKDRVLTVRYFQNPFTKNDYFISSDRRYNIIVWDLENYEKKIDIQIDYEGFIYSCLLIFEEKKIWAVVSSLGANNITKAIDIDNQDLIIQIDDSKNKNIYYLDYWYNKEALDDDQKHNIIQCGKNIILISEFPRNETYHLLSTDEKHPYNLAGIVFKNNERDIFAVSATYGLIQFLDLATKTLVKSIELEDVHLYSFIRWNDDYLLLNDCLQRRILVLEMKNDYKIKSKVLCPEMYFDRFIKKIEHPIYGESFLSVGIDWKIKLFINRSINCPIHL